MTSSEQTLTPTSMYTDLTQLFDDLSRNGLPTDVSSQTERPLVVASLLPTHVGGLVHRRDFLHDVTVYEQQLSTRNESWDEFTIRRRWLGGTVRHLFKRVPVYGDEPDYFYRMERNAWDTGGSGLTANGPRSRFVFTLSRNGAHHIEGIRFGGNHASKATNPIEAAREMIDLFISNDRAARPTDHA